MGSTPWRANRVRAAVERSPLVANRTRLRALRLSARKPEQDRARAARGVAEVLRVWAAVASGFL